MPASLDNLKSILAFSNKFPCKLSYPFFFGHSDSKMNFLLAHLACMPTSEHAVHCFLRVESKTGIHDDVIADE